MVNGATTNNKSVVTRCVLVEHIKPALFIASLVLILHHFHVLGGLDAFFLRVLNTTVVSTITKKQEFHNSGMPPIFVVGIDDLYYENIFKQTSPLNRAELKKLLEAIATRTPPPKVLAVDLDLSPGPCPQTKDESSNRVSCRYSEDEQDLYRYITEQSDKGLSFALLTPFPVYDNELRKRKISWMETMSNSRVRFGSALIDSTSGMVTDVRTGAHRLGCLVNRFVDDPIADPCRIRSEQAQTRSATDSSSLICNLFKSNSDNSKKLPDNNLLLPLVDESHDPVRLTPLNFEFFEGYQLLKVGISKSEGKNLTEGSPGINEFKKIWDKRIEEIKIEKNNPIDVVYLGGIYSDGDRFNTPMGRISGVVILAAEYYSLLNPISRILKWASYFIEICLGVFLGCLFEKAWHSYFTTIKGKPLHAAYLFTVKPFLILAGSVFLLLIVSLWVLKRYYMQLDITPLAIGMFLESLAAHLHSGWKESQDDKRGDEAIFNKAKIDMSRVTASLIYFTVIGSAVIILFEDEPNELIAFVLSAAGCESS